MIKLEETEKEYLLAIPPEQRDRAKRIQPRHWDYERRRWVYPRENRIYEALIAEFAEDAATVDISRPDAAPQADPDQENLLLKSELADIRNSINLIARNNARENDAELSELQEALANREQTIGQLQAELKKIKIEQAKHEKQLAESNAYASQLAEKLARRQSAISFDDQLKERALEATAGDHKFGKLLERLTIDRGLPIDLARAMDVEFRQLLDLGDQDINSYGLISEAADADAIPKDAIALAHLIRKQRNIIAHDDVHHSTYRAREILCLFAAALLWPEFPE